MSDFPDVQCTARVEEAGFPHRGPAILARERARVPREILSVTRGAFVMGEPPAFSDPFAFGPLDDALVSDAGVDGVKVPPAAYVAGRCEVHDDAASALLDERLRGVLAGLDPADLSAWAPSYVESAMALALRGHDEGLTALRGVFAGGRRTGDADDLVAYYLAQAGDPSGWPAIVAQLGHKTPHYRLMAARHLLAFRPYDGESVDGQVIDVRARLAGMLEDRESLVTNEIPALLAEAEVDGLVELLKPVAKKHRHRDTREVAEDVLAQVV